jgi:ATP-binding cassette subfamily B protein
MSNLNGQSTINKYQHTVHKVSTITVLKRVWGYLSPRRRRQLPVLVILMLLSGAADAFSLAAILPFLAIIVSPDQFLSTSGLSYFANKIGFSSGVQLVIPLTLAFILAAIIAGLMRLLVIWCIKNYTQCVIHEFAVEVYRRSLYQPYAVHVAINTSEVISAVEKVNTLGLLLSQVLGLVSGGITVMAIVFTLVVIEPWVALASFIIFGALYTLIISLCRKRLALNSRIVSRNMTLKVKTLQEGLGGIRDVILDQSQAFYCNLYRRSDWPLRQAKAENAFIAQSPRFFIESVAIVLIALLACGLSLRNSGEINPLPLLGTLALGAQRLLPALQQVFSAWAVLRGDQGSAEDVLSLLDQPLPLNLLTPSPEPLFWRTAIQFVSVGFHYGEHCPWVLKDLSFAIPKGYRVGFVGTTGSGKSTTVDLLMGLLQPTLGEVWVDGVPLQGEYGRAWQRTIAHVPQHIYLADTTIAENIALGVPADEIDLDRVRRAALQAQIADFVEQMPDGYWSALGERGIRLSGGQRQRLGIARALYKNASVLVFDEATSALDNTTEQGVMEAINGLADDLTVIMIAHRLSTVERCDLIIELSQGRVVAQGTYHELLASSDSFRQMAQNIS